MRKQICVFMVVLGLAAPAFSHPTHSAEPSVSYAREIADYTLELAAQCLDAVLGTERIQWVAKQVYTGASYVAAVAQVVREKAELFIDPIKRSKTVETLKAIINENIIDPVVQAAENHLETKEEPKV